MEFERRNGFGNGVEWEERENCENGYGNGNGRMTSSPARYIEHHVTKLDTLAGIAIRYGVEVADIKKMNGLVTDLQMFARKTLHIPLPGRHPPSPCLSNGHTNSGQASSEQTPRRIRRDLFESFQSLKGTPECKVSPAMSSLQSYYCLKDGRKSLDGCEMTVYNQESSSYHENGGSTTPLNPPLDHHRKSRTVANGFKTKDCDPTDDTKTDTDKWIGKLRLQHQNSEPVYTHTPEKLLKEENGSGGWFSAITGKGLALRTKAGSRTNLVSDAETSPSNGFLTTPGETVSQNSSEVRKSSSTSNLQDQDNSASIWFGLKPDLQAALSKPIFDGLPKPITGRRAKAALD